MFLFLQGSPGLGESETMYAIASGIYNGGGIVGALIAPILLLNFKYRTVIAIAPVIQIFGSTLYGLSTNGWMVIAGRFLLGTSDALVITSVMSYYTASTRNQPDIRLKKRLMIAYSVVISVSYVPFTGKEAHKVTHINCIAYFLMHGTIYCVLYTSLIYISPFRIDTFSISIIPITGPVSLVFMVSSCSRFCFGNVSDLPLPKS